VVSTKSGQAHACDELLARAALARDEDRHILRRHAPNGLVYVQHPRTSAAQQTSRFRTGRLIGEHDWGPQASNLGRLAHHPSQLLQVERLVQIVERSSFHRLDGGVRGLRQSHEDDRDARVDGADALKYIEAGTIGQPKVEKDDVGRLTPHLLHTFGAVCRHLHPMSGLGESVSHLLRQQHWIIVDKK
jgi:hypothetical protein